MWLPEAPQNIPTLFSYKGFSMIELPIEVRWFEMVDLKHIMTFSLETE